MLRTVTPIVAQSSDEASLRTTGMVPAAGVAVEPDVLEVEDTELEPPPPPHATRVAATLAANALHTERLMRMNSMRPTLQFVNSETSLGLHPTAWRLGVG